MRSRRIYPLPFSAALGSTISIAVGAGLAAKLNGGVRVAVTSISDGTSNQGDLSEAFNMFAIYKLPAFFAGRITINSKAKGYVLIFFIHTKIAQAYLEKYGRVQSFERDSKRRFSSWGIV